MDIAPGFAKNSFSLSLAGGDVAADDGLRSAVLVSLFSDRRANSDDRLPGDADDRRGWWGDGWPDAAGDLIGSRLWLLSREKQLSSVFSRAKEYAEEALAWLVEDGIARVVSVTAEWSDLGMLGLLVVIRLPDGSRWTDVYNYPLEG